MLPWELQEAEEALLKTIKQIADNASAEQPTLEKEHFPNLYANFSDLRKLTFKGVKLHEPLVSENNSAAESEALPPGDAPAQPPVYYSVDEYMGVSWGPGDAVMKDEVSDLTSALYHFLDCRFRKNKGAPRQGGSAVGHQTLDTAGVEARKLVMEMGKVFDLRTMVVPLDGAAISAASSALAKIHAAATTSGVKLAPLAQLATQLVELRRRVAAAASSPPYSERDVVVEQRGGTKVETGDGWFSADGVVKSGTVIMKALFQLRDGVVPEISKNLGQILYLFQHCALKSKNEACVEGYGSIIERHASKLRGNQDQANYANEGFIHINGPQVHDANDLLERSLNLFFGKDKNGKQKPWHFVNTEASAAHNAGVLKHVTQSKVLKRVLSEPSKVSFTAKKRRTDGDGV